MGMPVSLVKRDGSIAKSRIKELYRFEGLGKEKCKTEVYAGDIVAIMGLEDFDIGDTVADFEELVTFSAQNPTPVIHADRNPIWRMESVVARLIEALAFGVINMSA